MDSKSHIFRLTTEDRRLLAAVQKELRAGGYSDTMTDAIRYALRRAAPVSAQRHGAK